VSFFFTLLLLLRITPLLFCSLPQIKCRQTCGFFVFAMIVFPNCYFRVALSYSDWPSMTLLDALFTTSSRLHASPPSFVLLRLSNARQLPLRFALVDLGLLASFSPRIDSTHEFFLKPLLYALVPASRPFVGRCTHLRSTPFFFISPPPLPFEEAVLRFFKRAPNR